MSLLEKPSLSPIEASGLGLISLIYLWLQFYLLRTGLTFMYVISFLILSLLGSLLWAIISILHSRRSAARAMTLSIGFFILLSGAAQKLLFFLPPNFRLIQISALINLAGYMSLLYGISKMIAVRWFAATGKRSVKAMLVFMPLFTLYLAQQSPILLSYVAFDLICFFLASIGALLFPRGLPNDVLACIQVAAIPSMLSDFIRYGGKVIPFAAPILPFEEVIASFPFALLAFLSFLYLRKVRRLKEVVDFAEVG
ncbi:MAG: hypothetical protein DRO05_05090 [Thermoproteota archaeon]|nr:MAG: hypothetical protein DRO05_05090 [Candidatus Korarchaeota archaeon]